MGASTEDLEEDEGREAEPRGSRGELRKPETAGQASSFFSALRLTIGGDVTRLPGLQLPLSLTEPTVILQVAQPRLAFAHGRRACAPSVRAQRSDGTVTQRCTTATCGPA